MFGSDRGKFPKIVGLILAALAAVTACFAISDFSTVDRAYIDYAAHQSQNYAEQAQDRIRDSCGALPTVSYPDCVAKEENAAREYERNEYDLAAQMTMAWWTKVMGSAAVIGVFLSSVGIFLVYTTFSETRKQAAEAQASNKFMRWQDERANEPRLRFIEAGGTFVREGQNVTGDFTGIITNDGLISAREIELAFYLHFGLKWIDPLPVFEKLETKRIGSLIGVIHADQKPVSFEDLAATLPENPLTDNGPVHNFMPRLFVKISYVWGTDSKLTERIASMHIDRVGGGHWNEDKEQRYSIHNRELQQGFQEV
tara:strand:- start:724 stop:1659 length:936 start_codon:yes stop_codon:yes gene_type:complete